MPLPNIASFLAEHHLLSLATAGERMWCCSMFYAYDPGEVAFIVASEEESEHMRNVRANSAVAGTVALETKQVGKIRGIQFVGHVQRVEGKRERDLYFGRFPYARMMHPTLWRIVLSEIKMTDNTLGFGKKLFWKRPEEG